MLKQCLHHLNDHRLGRRQMLRRRPVGQGPHNNSLFLKLLKDLPALQPMVLHILYNILVCLQYSLYAVPNYPFREEARCFASSEYVISSSYVRYKCKPRGPQTNYASQHLDCYRAIPVGYSLFRCSC